MLPTAAVMVGNPQRVEPERLDFYRLADSRRDNAVTNFRVHPGELKPRLASRQQSVSVQSDSIPGSCRVPFDNRLDGPPKQGSIALNGRLLVRRLEVLKGGDHKPQRCIRCIELWLLTLIGKPVRQHALRDGLGPC